MNPKITKIRELLAQIRRKIRNARFTEALADLDTLIEELGDNELDKMFTVLSARFHSDFKDYINGVKLNDIETRKIIESFTGILTLVEKFAEELNENHAIKAMDIVLNLNHRHSSYEFYKNAFESKSDVLILSIMSEHSLKVIKPLLDASKTSGTTIRVLTFDPNSSPDVMESIRVLLQEHNENPQKTIEQIKNAYANWKDLAKIYPNLKIRCYHCIPSIQGVFVKDKYITVEVMTYATPPDDRLGFIVKKEQNPKLYEDLYKKYDNLWLHSIER